MSLGISDGPIHDANYDQRTVTGLKFAIIDTAKGLEHYLSAQSYFDKAEQVLWSTS
jgi:hypothetical protein